ncbi:hypothetical protein IMG5_170621 [Ichthyophthirius multifiliis]|uniref:Uncharacterized protein n=1 Tax=Ichthyophthirius multifiliis TaxID=5932 RepID=G0R1H8_ICHMU|nr:hypothetical protein IMG5_170621 [Ichthyophthirius multifiliis]EGR28679.1 hypothetical protein IMG5_170621 [Ichthyophthirius multifiliis]|eukprot:XP_004029915.1 hypothetical protein IMG5_170621 [Ichthyophthirius multifiliis]
MSFGIDMLKYKINEIILWGFSLGSGPAVHLASKYKNIKGLILEAPLASVYLFLEKQVDINYQDQESDIYGNIWKIGKVQCSIMLIHGKSDECLIIDELKHNDLKQLLLIKKSVTSSKLKEFIEQVNNLEYLKTDYSQINQNEQNQIIQEQEILKEYNYQIITDYFVD